MSTLAHYTTQASSYDRLLVGKRLTDRRITALKKQGYFGTGIIAQVQKEKTKKKRELLTFKKMLMEFGK